jgi:hypothetical protein
MRVPWETKGTTLRLELVTGTTTTCLPVHPRVVGKRPSPWRVTVENDDETTAVVRVLTLAYSSSASLDGLTIHDLLTMVQAADFLALPRVVWRLSRELATRLSPHDMPSIMRLYRYADVYDAVRDAAASLVSRRGVDDLFEPLPAEADLTTQVRVDDWVCALPLELFEHGLIRPPGLEPEIKARLIMAWGDDVDEDVVRDLFLLASLPRMLRGFVSSVLTTWPGFDRLGLDVKCGRRPRRITAALTLTPSLGLRFVGLVGGFRVYALWSCPVATVWRVKVLLPELTDGTPTIAQWGINTDPPREHSESVAVDLGGGEAATLTLELFDQPLHRGVE